jgi:hypothetical protein
LLPIGPVQASYWGAVINGVMAAPSPHIPLLDKCRIRRWIILLLRYLEGDRLIVGVGATVAASSL